MADPVFEIVQWVEAPPEDVFAFFTNAEKMALWHGVEVRLDPRPGGEWWVRHANGSVLCGSFVSLDPPRGLVFTWGFEREADGATPAGGSRVEVAFAAEREGTRITLRHTGFAPSDPVGGGWEHFLPELSRVA